MQFKPAHTPLLSKTGEPGLNIFPFSGDALFRDVQRKSSYSVILVLNGTGSLKAHFTSFSLEPNSLSFFSPFQPFSMEGDSLSGIAMQFHPDFFCIHYHQKEVSCSGVLFNNVFDSPCLPINQKQVEEFIQLFRQMETEIFDQQLAQYESLVSYLKIFLITATRIRTTTSQGTPIVNEVRKDPIVLQALKDAIEEHFKTKHAPSEYAQLLHISPKALGKITKSFFSKTLTDLISERIVIEAKRELYLTSKPIKQIAWELGYSDEHYFSRFFKSNAEVSPQFFRDKVGFAVAER